jgi:hypothetical protein
MALSVQVRHVTSTVWKAVGVVIAADLIASLGAALGFLPYTITRFFDGDVKVNVPTGGKTTLLLASTVLLLGCWAAGLLGC